MDLLTATLAHRRRGVNNKRERLDQNRRHLTHKAKKQFLRAADGSRRGGVGINTIGYSLTMEQLCQVLENGLDRPLADETPPSEQ